MPNSAPELLDPASLKETKFEKLGALTVGDKNFVRIRYVRHEDEILVGVWYATRSDHRWQFCLGIASNRSFAERVSQRICSYLSEALNIEFQSNLTHVSEEPPMFLGVRVSPYAATKFARQVPLCENL